MVQDPGGAYKNYGSSCCNIRDAIRVISTAQMSCNAAGRQWREGSCMSM